MRDASVAELKEHIICVDDEEGILTALRQQLGHRFGNECEISVAQSAQDALELVQELQRENEPVAVIIADQIMPGMKGVELLEEVHRLSPATTKVLLTGQAGLDAVVAAINRAGLNRYISKPWDEPDLRLTVENLLRTFRLHRENMELLEGLQTKNAELARLNDELEAKVRARTAELEAVNARLSQLAVTDGLTGLFNHRYLHERLQQEVERARRSGAPVSMMMVDVDHFKTYNDRCGHPAGDAVLREVARLLSTDRRITDVVARYGGEEFALLFLDTDKAAAALIAERVRAKVANTVFPRGCEQPGGAITVSAGVASVPEDALTAKDLVAAADAALYRAKRCGRNVVVSAGPEDDHRKLAAEAT
jgi:diguanylate cyclase (GGDEF)-like protein